MISSDCIQKIFLLDNSPSDSLRDLQELDNHIVYIFNDRNIGYGAAHNIAIKKAFELQSDYHIVVNPDISFNNDVLSVLINYMNNNPDVVYVLPKVVYPNGDIQYLCKLLPTPINLFLRRFLPKLKLLGTIDARYSLQHFGYNDIINPPCLSGCFMFMRLSTMKMNDLLFDHNFFMYCEDFDLIRRLHRYGQTVFFPDATIIHDHAKGSYHNIKLLFQHMISACIYFNKYGWFFDKERKEMNTKILHEIEIINKRNKV